MPKQKKVARKSKNSATDSQGASQKKTSRAKGAGRISKSKSTEIGLVYLDCYFLLQPLKRRKTSNRALIRLESVQRTFWPRKLMRLSLLTLKKFLSKLPMTKIWIIKLDNQKTGQPASMLTVSSTCSISVMPGSLSKQRSSSHMFTSQWECLGMRRPQGRRARS